MWSFSSSFLLFLSLSHIFLFFHLHPLLVLSCWYMVFGFGDHDPLSCCILDSLTSKRGTRVRGGHSLVVGDQVLILETKYYSWTTWSSYIHIYIHAMLGLVCPHLAFKFEQKTQEDLDHGSNPIPISMRYHIACLLLILESLESS